MKTISGLVSIARAAELINDGRYLSIAGDEAALKELPKGNWIGGTIPYFMTEAGGAVSRTEVFIDEMPVFDEAPTLRFYDVDALPHLCRNAPEYGYTLMIVPAFSACHSTFAENAPNYEDMYIKPLIGWIAGVHLDDLPQAAPKTVLGTTGEFSTEQAVVVHVPLPPEKIANIDIVNLFQPGDGESITFEGTGFSAQQCKIGGKSANLAQYMTASGIDTRLPLVADYCGAMINVSIKQVDATAGRVDFYAPVFAGVTYRFAAPVADYVREFERALPSIEDGVVFSCNCILNFLYSNLEGKRTGHIVGPVTFGEIAYQLLNQTLVYLTITE